MIVGRYLTILLAVLQPAIASDSCYGQISISSQSDVNAISDCQDLKGTLTISRDATGFISLNELETIQGGFTIEGTSDLTGVSLSNLQTIKGDLSVKSNGALTQLSLPNLEQVDGDVRIEDNNQLTRLQLNNLEEVKGGLVLAGAFDSVSLSNLDQVNGKTSIQGSGDLSCKHLSSLQSDGVFKGSFSCSAGSSGLSAGAKAGIAIGVIAGVAIIAALIWFLYKRRKATPAFQSVPTAAEVDPEKGAMQPPAAAAAPSTPAPVVASNIPRKPISPAPPEPDREIPMLDSGPVHEVSAEPTGHQIFELDGGPVHGSHQQSINHE